MNQLGIDLERNYEIPLRSETTEFDESDEIIKIKNDLIQEIDEIHALIEEKFYESGEGGPLYDWESEILHKNLTATVLQSSVRLPHGWPSAGWF